MVAGFLMSIHDDLQRGMPAGFLHMTETLSLDICAELRPQHGTQIGLLALLYLHKNILEKMSNRYYLWKWPVLIIFLE